MRQTDTEHQRILNALLVQARSYDEGRYNDICALSEQAVVNSRWLVDTLSQKNWDANNMQQRTGQLQESVLELNNRKDTAFDKDKIDLFLNHIRNEIPQTGGRQKKERLRLGVFTPLSPLKNGIADYMTVILLSLKQYADIEIYTDEGYEPDDPDILQSFAVYRHERFHELHDRYDLILYEIGNNPHHAYIVPYALQYPGVLELHDFCLDYLYRCLPPEYQKIACAESVCAKYPEGCDGNPLNMYLLKASRGVLVHSEFARQAVFDERMSIDVRKIEHFSNAVLEKQDASGLIKKHGLEDSFVFACFGFVNDAKRVEAIVVAFSNIIQKYSTAKLKLLIVGEFTEERLALTKAQIRKYHLGKHVVMTGYVTLSDMHKYISLTDVCLNLRYPYGGESSGTLARIMGMGKACIVSRVGAFDEMPDYCCHKIAYEGDGEKEIRNIINAMSILFENNAYRRWIGVNAQIYVMEHLNLKRTTQLYCEALERFYCKPTFDTERLMEKAALFLGYNYFDAPYHAAAYLSFRLYSLIYGVDIEEQTDIGKLLP